MARYFASQRRRGWLQDELNLCGLVSVLLIALMAGCSSSNSPGASGGSGGSASTVVGGSTSAGGGQTTVGGASSTTSATPTGGSSSPGGTIAPVGGTTGAGGVGGATTGSSGTTGGGGTTNSGGTTGRGGTTGSGGTTESGGTTGGGGTTNSGGTISNGGTTGRGGTTGGGGTAGGGTTAGGTTARGGTTSTGGTSSSGGATSTGRADAGADAAQDVAPPDGRGAGGAEAGPVGGAGGTVAGGTGVASFHCMNWADNRDNFNTGHLLLSGMTSDTDTYAGVTTTANIVLGAFVDLLKANSYRMPINEPTVLDAWWNSYMAAIDVGIAKGMKVIIGFWAQDKSIGKPVDNTRWYAMWKVVIDAYVSNPLVYYDIHNEPHGFTPAQWITQVNGWLAQFPNVPRQQIIVAGSGWDDNVGNVASSWPDLMMEIHNYANNGPTTQAGWNSNLLNRLGNAVSRTIVGEWAGTVNEDFTTGIDGNADKSFIVGTADTIFNNKMGSCWWAGAFAPSGGTSGTTFLVQKGTGASMTYTVQGAAALTYIQHSWGLN